MHQQYLAYELEKKTNSHGIACMSCKLMLVANTLFSCHFVKKLMIGKKCFFWIFNEYIN